MRGRGGGGTCGFLRHILLRTSIHIRLTLAMSRLLAVVVAACAVGANARPVPARPVGTLSKPFWSDEANGIAHDDPKKADDHSSTKDGTSQKKVASISPKNPKLATTPKHTLDDGHNHTSPELSAAQPTTGARAAQTAKVARDSQRTANAATTTANAVQRKADTEKHSAEVKQHAAAAAKRTAAGPGMNGPGVP